MEPKVKMFSHLLKEYQELPDNQLPDYALWYLEVGFRRPVLIYVKERKQFVGFNFMDSAITHIFPGDLPVDDSTIKDFKKYFRCEKENGFLLDRSSRYQNTSFKTFMIGDTYPEWSLLLLGDLTILRHPAGFLCIDKEGVGKILPFLDLHATEKRLGLSSNAVGITLCFLE